MQPIHKVSFLKYHQKVGAVAFEGESGRTDVACPGQARPGQACRGFVSRSFSMGAFCRLSFGVTGGWPRHKETSDFGNMAKGIQ